jgi:hypothetical protein
MTHKISNLYASKIFAEHPISMWALDDESYNTSLLTQSQKSLDYLVPDYATWGTASAITITSAELPEESFRLLSRSDIEEDLVTLSGPLVSASAFDSTKSTVCFNIFSYPLQALVDYFEIGLLYNTSASSTFYDSTQINGIAITAWQKLQFTSNLPDQFVSVQPIVKIKYIDGAVLEQYPILFNAWSLGQWSEEFNWETTGNIPQTLTDSSLISLLPNTSYKVIEADAYGFNEEDKGYYLVDNNKPLSINTSMPMVYGAGNITHIEHPITNNMPSLVIPGKGFLNESGRYQNRTLEFWLRLYADLHQEFRIVGPISSNDGLYVDQEYLTLKIGKNKKSYFVGKWFRPMLLDIKYGKDTASILLNGEEVLSMDIDQDYVSFPESNEDWIGFFGHEDIHPFDLDCIAIYPYLVPGEVAKRRFVYGQGVVGSEVIVNNFDGNSLYIDFPFANYSSTMSYPENNNWNGGYFNNLNATSKYIGSLDYDLPEILHSQDIGDLDIYSDNFLLQSGSVPFFNLSPSASYSNINSFIHFSTLAQLSSPTKSVFAMFKSTNSLINSKKTLMYFKNSFNSDVFEIAINGSSVQYLFNDALQYSASVSASTHFMVGLDMDKLSSELQTVLGNFFSNPQNISLNIGGDGTNTFTGNIYNVTFNNRFFTDKDCSTWFNQSGFINKNITNDESILQYIGCYSLTTIRSNPVAYLDLATAGYWEDSIPLSYFGKYIQDRGGNSYYDLDMIQFNIDYSSNPIINIPQHNNFTLPNHALKSYLTIQNYQQVGKIPYTSYSSTVNTTNYRVVDFDNTIDVVSTKYEIVDGTAIFPPKELVDFEEYYVTIHLEVKSKGVKTYPTNIGKMSLASIAHNETEFFGIGTKTGNTIYPIVKYGDVYSYKSKNPFRIYRDSTPYLYLTEDSGISCLANSDAAVTKGFSIPINSQRSSQYILGGIQLWLMYNQNETINYSKKIAKLITPDKKLDIYLVPESGQNSKRAFLKAFDAETGYEDITIDFYQNGIQIQSPVIKPLMWTSLVLSFGSSIALNGISGQLELYNGMVYNNIAFYKRSSLVLGQNISERTWQQVKTTEGIINNQIEQIDLQWEDWYNTFWLDLLEKRTTLTYIIDGERIFGAYLGISNSIVSDSSIVELEAEGLDVFSDVEWDQFVGRPV